MNALNLNDLKFQFSRISTHQIFNALKFDRFIVPMLSNWSVLILWTLRISNAVIFERFIFLSDSYFHCSRIQAFQTLGALNFQRFLWTIIQRSHAPWFEHFNILNALNFQRFAFFFLFLLSLYFPSFLPSLIAKYSIPLCTSLANWA